VTELTNTDLNDLLMLGEQLDPDQQPPADQANPPKTTRKKPPQRPQIEPRDLSHAHQVYTRWLGKEYDLQVLDVVLSVAAANQLDGDPPWLLVVGGSGAAKTETVAPLAGAGAHVESTIASEAALLSGTPQHEHAKDAHGGLLVKIGNRGLLVLKDFTSIISMNRDARAALLAALREIHDGKWTRNVGAEGGRTLAWTGRLVLVGATTTAYDKAHTVIAAMGDRFALVRQDSTAGAGRTAAGRQALANVGNETSMRAELSAASAAVLAGVRPELATLTEADNEVLLQLADVVTLARTGVEHDYRGDVIDSHAPEMPTRFAKMLGQVARGGLALGMDRAAATAAAVRVAGDSMPPLRLAALADVATYPDSTLTDVKGRLQKPRATVDRTLQALHILGLITQGQDKHGSWTYRLSIDIDPTTVTILVTRNVSRHPLPLRKEGVSEPVGSPIPQGGSDKAGNQDHPPSSCRACGKPLDPILAPKWQTAQIHPSCQPQE
jgi:hypothetical protein